MLARVITIALIAGTLALAAVATHEDRIATEIERLDAQLDAAEKAATSDDAKGQVASLRELLARARRAKDPAYALYRLRDAFVGIETLTFVNGNAAASQSLPAFQKLWAAHSSKPKEPAPTGTLVQLALIESAATRAERLYDASLPYAKADSPASGVYYLGESQSNRKFGAFVRKIAATSSEQAPSREQVAAAVDAVEREMLSIFGADITNQKLIAVSVRIKEARELLAANRVRGAMLLALESRIALLRRGGLPGKHQAAPAVNAASVDALLRAWADDEELPMKETLRADVAPFFQSMYAQAPPPKKDAAQVKVTLVRWPYT
jgi:hypothetical protein